MRPPARPPARSDFERIDSELRAYDEKREQVIKRSRDIGKLSKQAIFSLHRGADEEAQQRRIEELRQQGRLLVDE